MARKAYVEVLPSHDTFIDRFSDALAHEMLLIMPRLSRGIDLPETGDESVFHELLGPIFLPGRAVDEGWRMFARDQPRGRLC